MNNRGWTLLEMLVGIVIIAVLFALMFPALSTVRRKMEASHCISNLRQYAINANFYMSENNGTLVAPDVDGNSHQPWTRFLARYPDLQQGPPYNGWMCPSHVRMRSAESSPPSSASDGRWLWWVGYHTNRYFQDSTGVAGIKQGVSSGRMSQIEKPSRTVLFLDSDTRLSAGNIDAYAGYYGDGRNSWYYKIWPAHGDFFNIAFFDGHVEAVRFNRAGPNGGRSAADYPEFIWKPY